MKKMSARKYCDIWKIIFKIFNKFYLLECVCHVAEKVSLAWAEPCSVNFQFLWAVSFKSCPSCPTAMYMYNTLLWGLFRASSGQRLVKLLSVPSSVQDRASQNLYCPGKWGLRTFVERDNFERKVIYFIPWSGPWTGLKDLNFYFYFFPSVLIGLTLSRHAWQLASIKGTVSRDFWPFFCFKDSTWAPFERTKKVLRTFSFFEDIPSQSSKLACPHSCWLRVHTTFFFRYGGFYIFTLLLLGV